MATEDLTSSFKKTPLGSIVVFFLFAVVPIIYFYWKAEDRKEAQLAVERDEAERRLTIENRLTLIEGATESIKTTADDLQDEVSSLRTREIETANTINSIANTIATTSELTHANVRRIETDEDTSRKLSEDIRQLQDMVGDLQGEVSRNAVKTEDNSKKHVEQIQRATIRAGERLVRDDKVRMNRNDIIEIMSWRDSSQIDQLDILVERVEFLQKQLDKIQTQ